jgi:hypothetical protein
MLGLYRQLWNYATISSFQIPYNSSFTRRPLNDTTQSETERRKIKIERILLRCAFLDTVALSDRCFRTKLCPH